MRPRQHPGDHRRPGRPARVGLHPLAAAVGQRRGVRPGRTWSGCSSAGGTSVTTSTRARSSTSANPPGTRTSTTRSTRRSTLFSAHGAKVVLFTMPDINAADEAPGSAAYPENEPVAGRRVQRHRRPRGLPPSLDGDAARPQQEARPPWELPTDDRRRRRPVAGRRAHLQGRRRVAPAVRPAHRGQASGCRPRPRSGSDPRAVVRPRAQRRRRHGGPARGSTDGGRVDVMPGTNRRARTRLVRSSWLRLSPAPSPDAPRASTSDGTAAPASRAPSTCVNRVTPDCAAYTYASPRPGTVVVTAPRSSAVNNREFFWSPTSPIGADLTVCATFATGRASTSRASCSA